MKFCQSGLALAISIGNFDRQSKALKQLALMKIDSGDFSGAKEDASESQRASKIAGNLFTEANALRIESVCWYFLGSYSHCLPLLDRATHLLELCGMSGGATHNDIRLSQSEIHRFKSEYTQAHNIQAHLLNGSSMDQNPCYHALTLINIAQIDVEIGGSEWDVLHNITTATLIYQPLSHSTGLRYCDMIRAALDVQQGNLAAARNLFKKCLRSAWGKDSEVVSYCLEKLGSVEQWSPVHHMLLPWTVTFLAHSCKCKQRLELHKALQFLGDVFQAQGDQETALSLFTAALGGFTQMDVHRSRAECMVRLGDISKLNGDELQAVKLWETARPLFERSLQKKQLVHLNAKLAGLSHYHSQEFQEKTLDHQSDIPVPTENPEQF
jgi:tetratricopeptide (TPR) repeat protein